MKASLFAILLVLPAIGLLSGCDGDSSSDSDRIVIESVSPPPTNSASGNCGEQVVEDYNNAVGACSMVRMGLLDYVTISQIETCRDAKANLLASYPDMNCQVTNVSTNLPDQITADTIRLELLEIDRIVQEKQEKALEPAPTPDPINY